MTVAELIERLQKFSPAMRVVTPGFDESNYDDLDTVELIDLVFCDDAVSGHCGRHLEVGSSYARLLTDEPDEPQPQKAVLVNF